MYKLIATDLDKTLFNDSHKVCERNRQAIDKAVKQGVKVVPCTGRGPGFLGGLLEETGLNQEGCYSILCNGACIMENASEKLITCKPVDFQSAKVLFEYGKDKDLCIEFFTPERVYYYFAGPTERLLASKFGKSVEFRTGSDISDLEDKRILKVLFVKDNIREESSLEEFILNTLGSQVDFSYSNERLMEINRKGVNKGAGLKDLSNYLNLDLSETIGVGDNLNDLELIKTAGLGAAMANAVPELKQISDIITQSDHNQGGVAELIETYLLTS